MEEDFKERIKRIEEILLVTVKNVSDMVKVLEAHDVMLRNLTEEIKKQNEYLKNIIKAKEEKVSYIG
jgi:cell division FtsZ-interacting protein ZapD